MNTVANLFNRLNDLDLTWVGFRALRPAREQNMSARVVLIFSLFYGPLAAGLALLMALLILGRSARADVLWSVAGGAALGFVALQSVAAACWNRRARLLRQQKANPS
jgi:hypothetical protein